jgi:hypothetical protein
VDFLVGLTGPVRAGVIRDGGQTRGLKENVPSPVLPVFPRISASSSRFAQALPASSIRHEAARVSL